MTRRQNILFIMTDQHRIDHLGYDPRSVMATPHIDRIAGSAGFTECQSANPLCQPARAALLTGKYSHQVGMLTMSGDLSQQHRTYPQALQEAGYYTTVAGKLHLLQGWDWFGRIPGGHRLTDLRAQMQGYGFDEVWEASGKFLMRRDHCDYAQHLQDRGLLDGYWDHIQRCQGNTFSALDKFDQVQPWPFAEADYVDIATTTHAIEQIRQRPADKPFFTLCSLCGPHVPYDPPQRFLDAVPYREDDNFCLEGEDLSPEAKRSMWALRQAYQAMIACIDEQVGRLFDCLEDGGLLDDTVVVFTSDHGEMLGDHYRMQKGFPYWQSVGVPLAIRHPEHLGAIRSATPVEHVDITATILDVAGLDPQQVLSRYWPSYHDMVPGHSLLPILRGETDAVREWAFSECDMKWHDAPKGDTESHVPACWQALTTERFKYVRHVDTTKGPDDFARELLFDRAADPDEVVNLIDAPEHAAVVARCRQYREWVMATTLPGQTSWAPVANPLR
ncbi:MAG: sulfatase-like hydrolase/transferase [Planctomycetota bacterium]|jgi:arylsulfatase|nr:sulfatase-like hydrolase/transferase [Planctomycetota bacterium]